MREAALTENQLWAVLYAVCVPCCCLAPSCPLLPVHILLSLSFVRPVRCCSLVMSASARCNAASAARPCMPRYACVYASAGAYANTQHTRMSA